MLKTHKLIQRRHAGVSTRFRSDYGFTLIELLIVVAIVGIVAALAVVGLLRARMAANEASAVGSMRAINSAQQAYASSCAGGFYASSLNVLGSAPSGGGPFISPDLGAAAAVTKSGYLIALRRGTDSTPGTDNACNPLGLAPNLATAYYATANPADAIMGTRHFWTSAPGTIYADRANAIGHTEGLTPPPAPAVPLEAAP